MSVAPRAEAMPSAVAVMPVVATPVVAMPIAHGTANAAPITMPVSFGAQPTAHGSAPRSRANERANDADCFDSKIDVQAWPARDGVWSTGLSDCCVDSQSCMLGSCFPGIQFGFTHMVAFGRDDSQGSSERSNLLAAGYMCKYMGLTHVAWTVLFIWAYLMARLINFEGPMLVVLVVLVVLFFVAYLQRSAYGTYRRGLLRQKYGIVSSAVSDCLMHFLCEPCAVCQEAREVKIRLQSATVAGNVSAA